MLMLNTIKQILLSSLSSETKIKGNFDYLFYDIDSQELLL